MALNKMFPVSGFVPSEAQREKLKEPLGELVKGEPEQCIRALMNVLNMEKPTQLILVGDTIARTALQSEIQPSVIIIDGKEKRQLAIKFPFDAAKIRRTRNKPGGIEPGAWKTVESAVQEGNNVVLVDGEEDLLTLPAILSAPLGSLVAYGQPDRGIVLVRVTPEKKDEINAFLEEKSGTKTIS